MAQNQPLTEDKRARITAVAGTILFHLLLLLVLIMLALRTPLPLPGEEGVEVNLGNSDQGMGLEQPIDPALLANAAPQQQQSGAKEEILTQDIEEAPAIENPSKIKNKNPSELTKKVTQPVAVNKEPVVDPNAMYKGSSNKSSKGQNQGITGQPGDQGKANGTPGSPNYTGQGGAGNGPSFDLGGRSARNLPLPVYNSDEQGAVVVNIWVNRQGQVVKTQVGKGTNITDLGLRKRAEDAAKRAVFSANPNAAEEQKGKIIYNFRKSK